MFMRDCLLRVLTISTVLVGGCHIHPLQDNVTDFSTSHLVGKIQCEAAEYIKSIHPARDQPNRVKGLTDNRKALESAIKRAQAERAKLPVALTRAEIDEQIRNVKLQSLQLDRAIEELLTVTGLATEAEVIAAKGPNAARMLTLLYEAFELANQGDALKIQVKIFNTISGLQKEITDLLEEQDKLYSDIISFESHDAVFQFIFTITETNNLTGGTTFTWPIALGSLVLGVSAGDKKSRVGDRRVNVAITFTELAAYKCRRSDEHDSHDDKLRAISYPITGTIGLAEVIEQYLRLSADGAEFGKFESGGKSYQDKITFTTERDISLKPSINLSRRIGQTSVLANVDATAGRKDVHELTLFLKGSETGAKPSSPTEIIIRRMPIVGTGVVRLPP